MNVTPAHTTLDRIEGTRAALAWRFDGLAVGCLSSASVGGGFGAPHWALNVGVTADYRRVDLAAHADEVATVLGLTGSGVTLFTAVRVADVATACEDGLRVDATVGVTRPTWAADVDDAISSDTRRTVGPGTINIVIQCPVALTPAAAVQAVITATEAKTQALFEHGIPGTGTASDAVLVCWPLDGGAECFGGPRSSWGARIGRTVHQAVRSGLLGNRP